MTIFKRLSNTIITQFESIIGDIENHDAIILANIDDLKKNIAKANVRRNRIAMHVSEIEKDINRLESNTKIWQERAVDSSKRDRSKALKCISRSKQCENDIEQLKPNLKQYKDMEIKMTQDKEKAEQSLRELIQKHKLMSARQISNATNQATQNLTIESPSSINDTFDRWEVKLQESEVLLTSDDTDTFEKNFVQEEQEEELQKSLNELLKKEQV